ncbi:hypothetical protein Zmor_013591 [Zophobas morio]|uniref:Uncharacterized protein n=1 Tax=Zophobas morio TaxID=2755281 RepID=A0AA38IHP9_9CUCU|nr:hypothetical protein Zmor_013591 [Zophobas morio]
MYALANFPTVSGKLALFLRAPSCRKISPGYVRLWTQLISLSALFRKHLSRIGQNLNNKVQRTIAAHYFLSRTIRPTFGSRTAGVRRLSFPSSGASARQLRPGSRALNIGRAKTSPNAGLSRCCILLTRDVMMNFKSAQ